MTNSNQQTTVGISYTFGILFGVTLTTVDVRYKFGIVRYTLGILFGEVTLTTVVV